MDFLKKTYHSLPGISIVFGILQEVKKSRLIQAASFRKELLSSDPRYLDSKSLAQHEHQVFSQSGEDGIIREIFRRIGTTNQYFVEFGVENGLENNTHFLLQQGWQGCWIEGNGKHCESMRSTFDHFISKEKLRVKNSLITAENIQNSFRELSVPKEFDLLSIDIDGNDYWIWKKLSEWQPRAVVIEYNAHFPPDFEWILPRDDTHTWDMRSTYFGASLKSLEKLGMELGYRLVYCNIVGSNAFFVREDLHSNIFPEQTSSEYHFSSFKPWLVLRGGYAPNARPGITSN